MHNSYASPSAPTPAAHDAGVVPATHGRPVHMLSDAESDAYMLEFFSRGMSNDSTDDLDGDSKLHGAVDAGMCDTTNATNVAGSSLFDSSSDAITPEN